MSTDAATLAVYAENAELFADRFASERPGRHLSAFIASLPPGGKVLDLGCGPGHDSAHMRAAGFVPDPVDASPEMVALANRLHGIGARLCSFDGIVGEAIYDGVWASYSLLHATRADLPRHLAVLARALKPLGMMHLGMKSGSGEGRDRLGRFYTYVTLAELRGMVERAGLSVAAEEEGADIGLAGTLDPYVVLRAVRPGHGG